MRNATGFLQRSAACHRLFYIDLRPATIVIVGGKGQNFYLYIVNRHFSKIVALEGAIRKVLNMVAV
jgi:hypothetical protein